MSARTGLDDTMKALLGRDLTADQIKSNHLYQELFEIPEEDPLIVVLALMGANKIIIQEQAELLQKMAKETIELHQQTLRQQSTMIAKELIVAVGDMVANTHVGIKYRRTLMVAMFLSGIIAGGVLSIVLRLWGH